MSELQIARRQTWGGEEDGCGGRSFRWICGATVRELQDDDGEGQERERETEADQKEAAKNSTENTNTDGISQES